MKRMNNLNKIILVLVITSFGFGQLKAQDDEEANANAQANNPLANMTTFNFHNYYVPKLTDAPAENYMNTTWLRYASGFADGRIVLRVSAPLSTVGTLDGTTGIVNSSSGLGDMNAFASYNFISKPTATVGIGPLIAAPTASADELGTGKWQGGLAFVAFIAKSPVFQFGGLVTWQTSFAGDENREKTSVAAIQPFYFWQRGAPIWVFDLKNSVFHVPMAVGIGKVVKVDNTLFNLFVEAQYTAISKGTQPQFQIFTGINIQLL